MFTAFSHGAKKHRSDLPIIFPLFPQSKERTTPKIHLPLKPSSERKKIGTEKSKSRADAIVEEVNFLCVLVGSNEKERTDMKLENARMKQKIADMKQELVDMQLEKVDMKLL